MKFEIDLETEMKENHFKLRLWLKTRKLRGNSCISRGLTRGLTIIKSKIRAKIIKSSATTPLIAISASTSIIILIKSTLKDYSHSCIPSFRFLLSSSLLSIQQSIQFFSSNHIITSPYCRTECTIFIWVKLLKLNV